MKCEHAKTSRAQFKEKIQSYSNILIERNFFLKEILFTEYTQFNFTQWLAILLL